MTQFPWLFPYPDNSESILDKEVEDESDKAYEREDSNASSLPWLCFIQLFLCNSSEKECMCDSRSSTSLQNIIPQLSQGTSELCHVHGDGIIILDAGLKAHITSAPL